MVSTKVYYGYKAYKYNAVLKPIENLTCIISLTVEQKQILAINMPQCNHGKSLVHFLYHNSISVLQDCVCIWNMFAVENNSQITEWTMFVDLCFYYK